MKNKREVWIKILKFIDSCPDIKTIAVTKDDFDEIVKLLHNVKVHERNGKRNFIYLDYTIYTV